MLVLGFQFLCVLCSDKEEGSVLGCPGPLTYIRALRSKDAGLQTEHVISNLLLGDKCIIHKKPLNDTNDKNYTSKNSDSKSIYYRGSTSCYV